MNTDLSSDLRVRQTTRILRIKKSLIRKFLKTVSDKEVSDRGHELDRNIVLECDVCARRVHVGCLEDPPKKQANHWICDECVQCRCCGSTKPGGSGKWMYDYTMCSPCGELYDKKQYCLICEQVWDSKPPGSMVCCELCKRWLHCACVGLSPGKSLPESVCPECAMRKKSARAFAILN
eukprot:674429_1